MKALVPLLFAAVVVVGCQPSEPPAPPRPTPAKARIIDLDGTAPNGRIGRIGAKPFAVAGGAASFQNTQPRETEILILDSELKELEKTSVPMEAGMQYTIASSGKGKVLVTISEKALEAPQKGAHVRVFNLTAQPVEADGKTIAAGSAGETIVLSAPQDVAVKVGGKEIKTLVNAEDGRRYSLFIFPQGGAVKTAVVVDNAPMKIEVAGSSPAG